MKRKLFSILTLTLFACTLSFSFAYATDYADNSITMPDHVVNKKIIIVDAFYVIPDNIIVENGEVFKINTLDNAIKDLRSGNAGAVIYDYNVLKYVAASNPDLEVLPDIYFKDGLVFIISKDEPVLKQLVDDKIDEMTKNGQLDGMRSYWFSETGLAGKKPEVLINIKEANDNRLFSYGTFAVNEPFAFYGNANEPMGYEIELVEYVAQSMGIKLDVQNMLPGQLLNAVQSGDLDMAGGFMATNPALKDVLVSKPYFGSGLGMMILKK